MTETTKALRMWPLPALFWSLAAVVGICASACGLGETAAPVKPAVVVAKPTFPATLRRPQGAYLFRSALGPIDLNIAAAKNPNIAGYVLRDTWASVQPKQGVAPNFGRLRAAAAIVAQQGKQWQFELFGATAAAAWTGGVNAQFDEQYQLRYMDLVEAAGKAFADDKNLVAVHVTQPMNTSPEFRLDGTTLGKGDWQTKALAANDRAIRAYRRAFPNVTIVLNLHNPLNANDGFVAKQIAQARILLGPQLALQENALNAKASQQSYNLFREVKNYADLGYTAGFEQLSVSSESRYGGTFSDSLTYARGVGFLILYAPDDKQMTKPWK